MDSREWAKIDHSIRVCLPKSIKEEADILDMAGRCEHLDRIWRQFKGRWKQGNISEIQMIKLVWAVVTSNEEKKTTFQENNYANGCILDEKTRTAQKKIAQ